MGGGNIVPPWADYAYRNVEYLYLIIIAINK